MAPCLSKASLEPLLLISRRIDLGAHTFAEMAHRIRRISVSCPFHGIARAA